MILPGTYLTLIRSTISFFAACSAVTGALLAGNRDPASLVTIAAGVFLLASGASALNQFQERDIDGRMERTRRRPLPSGALPPRHALALSIGLIFAGLAILSLLGLLPLLLGVIAVLWYNGVYTLLKRKTAFATIPGALVGAVPPALGWTVSDESLVDPRLLALAAFFFIWQVPHFWLLLLSFRDDYARAGLPSITTKISEHQLRRITVVWIAAASASSLLLPLFGVLHSPLTMVIMIPAALWIFAAATKILGQAGGGDAHPLLFRKINVFLFVILLLLAFDSLFQLA